MPLQVVLMRFALGFCLRIFPHILQLGTRGAFRVLGCSPELQAAPPPFEAAAKGAFRSWLPRPFECAVCVVEVQHVARRQVLEFLSSQIRLHEEMFIHHVVVVIRFVAWQDHIPFGCQIHRRRALRIRQGFRNVLVLLSELEERVHFAKRTGPGVPPRIVFLLVF